jgi:hypothetical protein
MTQVARETGLSRESLYKALSGDRSPSFDTILKVISALGLQLRTSVKESAIVEGVAEVTLVSLVQLKSADVSCGKATLRTSPSSGLATTSPLLRHPKLLACHSGAALADLLARELSGSAHRMGLLLWVRRLL